MSEIRIIAIIIFSLLFSITSYGQPKHRLNYKHHQKVSHGSISTLRPATLVHYPDVLTLNVPELFRLKSGQGLAICLEYSRYIVHNGHISINCSVTFAGFSNHFGAILRNNTRYVEGSVFYLAPGVSFHPLGYNHILDPSFGIGFGVGTAYSKEYILDYSSISHTYRDEHFPFTALLLQGRLNVYPRWRDFVAGIHFAIGPIISAGFDNELMFQIGFKIGERF